MLKVKILPSNQLPDGKNIYKDYYLSFEPAHLLPTNPPQNPIDPYLGIKVPQSFLVNVWASPLSLTFTVAAVDHTLYSFDTYAPHNGWVLDDKLQLPSICERGLLFFGVEFPEDNRFSIKCDKIEYKTNHSKSLVRVRFGQARDIRHAQVASCLIAGVDSNENLMEIWLQDVIMIEKLASSKR